MSQSNHRQSAVVASLSRGIRKIERPQDKQGNPLPVSEYFGQLAFGLDQLKEKLSKDSFAALQNMVHKGGALSKDVADEIALVIKEWALGNGCTHFCHWFQPMTGLTAEKHDAFIDIKFSDLGQSHVLEKFKGNALIQSEPDASSFPSGGMRSTFEARGYTAWDPTSPLFIMESTNGRTLCIPSAFLSYYGHALDMKTPLLRSIEALSKSATKFLKLIGDVDVTDVKVTVGCEQEYFLIDRDYYALRPDLIMTGRSLLGRSSTRGQQFEDHYFGSIPSRILAFMNEFEQEMFKLGVPVKTRHNEVAPAQYESAPIFEDASVACDHNALTMDMLRKVAERHGMLCLLHEKPFKGINGSGKHNNWSMSTNRGDNLLDPGHTPHQNLRFLAVLSVVLKAVHDHADTLRVGIASPSNDHRLGANEAPPAIVSVFLGETLSHICQKIEMGEVIEKNTEQTMIGLGVSKIPHVAKDNTDRNRTSPFAFTGNKFEFRAVGSSQNPAFPNTFLCAAVADAFDTLSARLEGKVSGNKLTRDQAVLELIREVLKESKAIRFEGDNYSAEWHKEAEKRGLPNLKTTPAALKVLEDDKATEFLVKTKTLSKEEIKARHGVMVERYIKQIDMEAQTLIELVDTFVLPAVEKELTVRAQVAESVGSSKHASKHAKLRLENIEITYDALLTARDELARKLEAVRNTHPESKAADLYASDILPLMNKVREASDELEGQVSDQFWTLPKYREMLFLK